MERKNKIFFIVVVIVFLLVVTIFKSPVLDKKIIPVSFVLSENPGFGNSEEELMFGAIQENQSGSRNLEISNTFEEEIEISIKSSGEISDYLIVSENNFKLSSSESKNITFTIYTSGLIDYRKYSGEIIILSSKV